MGELVRLIRMEFYKMKHTAFLRLHILLPLFGILLFLCYYGISPHRWEGEVSAYIQVLVTALPLVISIVCAQSVSPEEQNHFMVFLGTAEKRRNAFLSKWFSVFFMGLFSMTLAVGGFMAGYCLILKRCRFDLRLTGMMILVMWLTSGSMYVLHVFLNLWKPKSISLGVGTVEVVISALMLTGLGDGIWPFLPCAFGGYWEDMLMRYRMEGKLAAAEYMRESFGINLLVTAALAVVAAAGFYYYEGRRVND